MLSRRSLVGGAIAGLSLSREARADLTKIMAAGTPQPHFNAIMLGAKAGTPGTLPAGWSYLSNATGLTPNVIGIGQESGKFYMDVQWTGTPSGTNQGYLYWSSGTAMVGTNHQTWFQSCYIKLTAGALTNISPVLGLETNIAGGVFSAQTQIAVTPNANPLITQLNNQTVVNSDAASVFVQPYFGVGLVSGNAVNATFRLGSPILVLKA